jgi:broad specificity phosphatase PhoE
MSAVLSRYSKAIGLVAAATCLWIGAQAPPDAFSVTTVFLVRHAERAASPPADPPLSAAGQKRAKQLAHVLAKARVKAVYTTPTTRTRQTVRPTAYAAGLTAIEYTSVSALASEIRSRHRGHRVLVAGHSDTLQSIAVALGSDARDCAVTGDEYDNLCVVTIAGGRAHGVNLQYGMPSP